MVLRYGPSGVSVEGSFISEHSVGKHCLCFLSIIDLHFSLLWPLVLGILLSQLEFELY